MNKTLRLGALAALTASSVGVQAAVLGLWDFNVDKSGTGIVGQTSASLVTDNFANASNVTISGSQLALNSWHGPANTGTSNNGRHIQIDVQRILPTPSLSFSRLVFSFATNGKGFTGAQASYSLDGTTFTNVGSVQSVGAGKAVDLSGVGALQGVTRGYFRLTFSGAAVPPTSTHTSGKSDIEDLYLEGTTAPVPEPFTMALGAAGLAVAARRRRRKS